MTNILKPNIPTLFWFVVGIGLGFTDPNSLFHSYNDSTVSCESDLAAARDSLSRAYVLPTEGPTVTKINSSTATSLMNSFALSEFANVDTFRAMNLHITHLEHMIQYHIDLETPYLGGFRIYNGLEIPGGSSQPSEEDIRHIIVPLSTDGYESMPSSDIWSFNPNDKFVLPCPKFCD